MRCDSLGVDHSYDSKFKDNNWLENIPDLVADQHKPMLADINGDLYRENINRMHQIAQVCKSRGITLYLVMPPVHPTYYQLMNQKQLVLIHNAITEVTNKWENVHSLEYFGDTRFNDEDFYDGNHLSSDIGAIKFTKILKDDILTDL